MSIFKNNKFPKVGALIGLTADKITDEALESANSELQAAGINAVLVISSETSLDELTKKIETLQGTIDSQTTQLSELNTAISEAVSSLELDTNLTGADAVRSIAEKAEEYGQQSGKIPDSKQDDSTKDDVVSNKESFYSEADAELAEYRKQFQTKSK